MGDWQTIDGHGYSIDASRLPIVHVEYPRTPDRAGFEWLFARYREIAERGGSVAWRVDLTKVRATEITALTRRSAAEVFAEHQRFLARISLCEARILSTTMTYIATAFDWIAPRAWPCGNFTNHADADAFIAKHVPFKRGPG